MSDEYKYEDDAAGAGEGAYDDQPSQNSGMAVAALVLAIPPTCITQIIALPLGIVALVKISGSEGRLRGQGLAIAALIVCGLQVLFTPFCISVVAAIAIPGMLRSRIGTNETAAIGTLRSLVTAQSQFQQQAIVDLDGDGIGEFGTLGELAGMDDVRGPQGQMNTAPFIAAILGVRDAQGIAQKSGYFYVVYLPSANGPAVREGMKGLPAQPADANVQEQRWCAYAWPNAHGQSGNRAFFVNQDGEVWATPNTVTQYGGSRSIPPPEAAYDTAAPDPKNLDGNVGVTAAGLQAGDGNVWVPAGN